MNTNKVIVVGSINMDIVAKSDRLPWAGETVFGKELKYFPGGKGTNQAVAAIKLGAPTVFFGKVGDDTFGRELLAFLRGQNLENKISVERGVSTGTAMITVSESNSENTIVVIPGANSLLRPQNVDRLPVVKQDILVSSFEIPMETIQAAFNKGRNAGGINLLNPSPAQEIPKAILELTDILVVNESELRHLSGAESPITSEDGIIAAVRKIRTDNKIVVVTLGAKGAIGFYDDEVVRVEAQKVEPVDTTGAGDCFVGALAARLAQHAPLQDAMAFANKAAAISVTRWGASPSMPRLSEMGL